MAYYHSFLNSSSLLSLLFRRRRRRWDSGNCVFVVKNWIFFLGLRGLRKDRVPWEPSNRLNRGWRAKYGPRATHGSLRIFVRPPEKHFEHKLCIIHVKM